MSQYITKIRTESGDMQIDYTALANLPQADTTLTVSGSFADAKTTGDKVKELSDAVANIADNLTPQAIGAVATINGIESDDSGNVTLTASDVGAAPSEHTHNKLTGLEADRVLVTNSDGESVVSSITVDKLNTLESIEDNVQEQISVLEGVDSNLQKQLNEHEHDYLPLTGGILTGATIADYTDVSASCIRNIHAGMAALTPGSDQLTTGAIYFQYE